MRVATGFTGREAALVALFTGAFAASEGPDEGRLIGGLVQELLAKTAAEDIRVFRAEDGGDVVGAAIFTRLTYPEDSSRVFLLSPMAVAAERQRRGVGHALLTHALEALRAEGVDVAITYGDPAYYGRVGFRPITEGDARAPLPLRLPHGWLGRSLVDGGTPALRGPSSCVPALNRSDIW